LSNRSSPVADAFAGDTAGLLDVDADDDDDDDAVVVVSSFCSSSSSSLSSPTPKTNKQTNETTTIDQPTGGAARYSIRRSEPVEVTAGVCGVCGASTRRRPSIALRRRDALVRKVRIEPRAAGLNKTYERLFERLESWIDWKSESIPTHQKTI
jgi:hypothetical protein